MGDRMGSGAGFRVGRSAADAAPASETDAIDATRILEQIIWLLRWRCTLPTLVAVDGPAWDVRMQLPEISSNPRDRLLLDFERRGRPLSDQRPWPIKA